MSDLEPHTLKEELEVRIIALLTGELPESEADELERILSVDEALVDFRDRMAALMGDIHTAREEISTDPGQSEMRLSPERRREIFPDEELFDLVSPAEEKKKWWRMGLLEIAAILAIAGILAAILIPSVGAVRQVAQDAQARSDGRSTEIERQMAESANFEAPAEKKVFALQTEIPPEVIEGTPQPIRIPATTPSRPRADSYGRGSGGRGVTERRETEAMRVDSGEIVALDQVESNWSFGFTNESGGTEMAARDEAPQVGQSSSRRVQNARRPVSAPPSQSVVGGDLIAGFGSADYAAADDMAPVDPFAAPPAVVTAPMAPRARPAAKPDSATSSLSASGPVDPFAVPSSAGSESQTRIKMLAQVDQAWERPKVFESRGRIVADSAMSYTDKLQQIVIPQVNFSGMPLGKVIETLEELSVEYDPEHRGVKLAYVPPAVGDDPRVNISLRNLSLDRILQFVTQQANFSYDRQEDRVIIQSAERSPAEQAAIARNELTRQTPKAEKQTQAEPISTFSLNVSDVSFKLAQAALASQRIPAAALIRSEEFVNSLSYGDPAPREDEPVTLNWEIAQHPYQHNRQIVRFSLQTQAAGRAANQPLNLNLLVDNSGSMQRPDRRAILEKSLESLQSKLTDQDQLNIVLFARQPRLIANASNVLDQKAGIARALNAQPEGGTNLESGLQVAYDVAQRSFDPAASNRVILMTDGAANLGNVDSASLAQMVVEQRKQGIALDAYGIGWEDYNDALLEEITRNGDGRYAFLNSVDSAVGDFAEKLAGTLRVAAADVKVQIIWNPERVRTYRQIGYDLHQLRAQDFRDNTVDAAEIGEAESGTALYVLQINEDPNIVGALGKLQVRYRVPATGEYIERAWPLEMPRKVPALQDAPASLRLAATSALFAERLANNPYAANYSFEDLEALAVGLPEAFPTQSRVSALQTMIQSAQSLFSRFDY